LNLPDPLISNKLYSIQTSNLNTWTTEGFNDLQQTYTTPTINVVNKNIIINTNETVKIYDLNGTLVSENTDLSILQRGIYIIILKTPQGELTKKIINL
jgi:hypothetical protein